VSGLTILVSSNLGPNLTRGKLLPLVQLPEVRDVIVVQDTAGPPLPHVRYVTLGPPRFGRLAHGLLRALRLCQQIARTRPALVMGIYIMPHGLLAYVLGRLARAHVCLHVIGGPREILDGGYWIDQWQVRRPTLEALYLQVLRRADAVMVVGTATREYLVSHGVRADRVHLMSSKIDAQRFRPVPGIRCEYDLLLSAQLIARKRVDRFLHILANLRRRFPRIRAGILGHGPLRGALERLAVDLGISDCVDFLGFDEATERYYTRAKVFVLTSSAEGLSLAMLEAMACGLPVVVPAVGDLADVVSNGVTGFVIDDHEVDGFERAIGTLLEQDALRRRLGDNARSMILHGYTVEDGARAWRVVLDRLSSQRMWAPVHGKEQHQ
jgi:glycosyltransferase involved in cell wall biosynthesis